MRNIVPSLWSTLRPASAHLCRVSCRHRRIRDFARKTNISTTLSSGSSKAGCPRSSSAPRGPRSCTARASPKTGMFKSHGARCSHVQVCMRWNRISIAVLAHLRTSSKVEAMKHHALQGMARHRRVRLMRPTKPTPGEFAIATLVIVAITFFFALQYVVAHFGKFVGL